MDNESPEAAIRRAYIAERLLEIAPQLDSEIDTLRKLSADQAGEIEHLQRVCAKAGISSLDGSKL